MLEAERGRKEKEKNAFTLRPSDPLGKKETVERQTPSLKIKIKQQTRTREFFLFVEAEWKLGGGSDCVLTLWRVQPGIVFSLGGSNIKASTSWLVYDAAGAGGGGGRKEVSESWHKVAVWVNLWEFFELSYSGKLMSSFLPGLLQRYLYPVWCCCLHASSLWTTPGGKEGWER